MVFGLKKKEERIGDKRRGREWGDIRGEECENHFPLFGLIWNLKGKRITHF